ncbi:flagellar export chaperone FliS [Brevibacillus sp. SYSU BS000544]|uniref:flagellar export chaperone FliS n=1 Tax=Brevibacillus sp. SYSU BS000544 TaxID=3416443 RepID=UPI003CE4CC81
MINNAAQTYQNNQVNTASPQELILMLYSGAIKFIKQTRTAIQEKNFDKASQFNLRVQSILNELIVTLDHNYPIAEQFLSLYEYMLRRMIEANVKKDIVILEEVEGLFVQFRDTWKEAMLIAKNM